MRFWYTLADPPGPNKSTASCPVTATTLRRVASHTRKRVNARILNEVDTFNTSFCFLISCNLFFFTNGTHVKTALRDFPVTPHIQYQPKNCPSPPSDFTTGASLQVCVQLTCAIPLSVLQDPSLSTVHYNHNRLTPEP